MLSPYGKPQTTVIIAAGFIIAVLCIAARWWWALGADLLIVAVLLAFFRDPMRRVPTLKDHVVSPADGRVRSIHNLDHYEPLGGPAVCVRIFLSVLDVHINRSPMHGKVASVTHIPGKFLNALKAESAEQNQSATIVLNHPTSGRPIAAVKQIAGAIARRIVCGAQVGEIMQRGQRYGMIKFGSTTELYLPDPDRVTVQVRQGQYVYGGSTVIAIISPAAVEPAAR